MLAWIARFGIRRPRLVLAAAVLVIVLCGAVGGSVTAHLKVGGFVADDAESARASALLDEKFGGAQPNLVLTVTAPGGVDSPDAEQAGARLAAALGARADVTSVRTYWGATPELRNALRSTDGRTGLVLARIAGDDNDVQQTAGTIADQLPEPAGVTVRMGGAAATLNDINQQIITDMKKAEAVALPLSLLVLIVVFGSIAAAALPLTIGIVSIVTTLAILRGLTLVTDVSIFALNMATALGLALAIDYSLFIVGRYREELADGHDRHTAIVRAMRRAGRTVLFSAATVAIALAALLVYPMYFLQSLAYSGIAVVAAAATTSIVILPALLMLLGPRIDALDPRRGLRKLFGRTPKAAAPVERTGWYRLARFSMRHAVAVTVAVVAVLLTLGIPFLGTQFGYPDDRVIHADQADSRIVGDQLRGDFANDPTATTTVVLPGYQSGSGEIARYATDLSRVDGVAAVLSSVGTFTRGQHAAAAPSGMANESGEVLSVTTSIDPFSEQGSAQLAALRAVPAPGTVLFTGAAAQNRDVVDAITARVPLVLGLVAITTLVTLFLFTGSVVLPVKALLLNVLSLTAAFGALVWVFQDGHLAGLVGVTPTGYLVANVPILMFCMAFGISMDYEVFVLSRIREEWLASPRTHADNDRAVALGVARTGRIVTAAALLMAIVLGALVTSKVSFVQLFGLGLAITVLVDATIIRCLLVPALMRLMGRFNWWAPPPLRWLHDESRSAKP
ncbi:MMPL family transporter [Nocardia suismassiliense]|uniref:MMPL family transporter n=1 Tax=Nocardia suismassiliense TaxID=2077092 RepID=A0ABW6R139_9NOCA